MTEIETQESRAQKRQAEREAEEKAKALKKPVSGMFVANMLTVYHHKEVEPVLLALDARLAKLERPWWKFWK